MIRFTTSLCTSAAAMLLAWGAATLHAQSYDYPSVTDYGAVGDGSTNDLSAFNSAITASLQQGSSVYPVRGVVIVPPGTYYLNGTLELENSVHLIGHSAGQNGGSYRTTLLFPSNTVGIHIVKGTTSPSQDGADGAIIEGLKITSSGGTTTTAHGILMEARAKVRDCYIDKFPGDGIHISGDTSDGTNADNWVLDSVTVIQNKGHGVYVEGNRAGAGLGIVVNAMYSGGWGVYDNSDWGNTWVGAHTSVNTSGSYRSDNATAATMFLNCYAEGGQGSVQVDYPGTVLGGNLYDGVNGTGHFMLAENTSVFGFNDAETAAIEISDGDSGQALTLHDTDNPTEPFRLKYTPGRWYLDKGNITGSSVLELYDRAATPGNGYARDMSASTGGIGFPKGYYGAGMKYRGTASASPTSGTWLRGDFLYDLTPSAGGYIGWICVSGGSPGTWKAFGPIDP